MDTRLPEIENSQKHAQSDVYGYNLGIGMGVAALGGIFALAAHHASSFPSLHGGRPLPSPSLPRPHAIAKGGRHSICTLARLEGENPVKLVNSSLRFFPIDFGARDCTHTLDARLVRVRR